MVSKERVKRAIHFNSPDRIPIVHAYQPRAVINYGEKLQDIFRKYPSDFGYSDEIDFSLSWKPPSYKCGEWKDKWGSVWMNQYEGLEGQVKIHPLEDWENLKNYRFPVPIDIFDFESEKRRSQQYNGERFIWGGWHILFERMHFLRGYEKLLLDLADIPKELHILAEGIFDFNVKSIKEWIKLPVDGIAFADDWGTQSSLMISPQIWRGFFKPYYNQMFSIVHEYEKEVYFHSDGYIMEIIPDLIEMGVDVLNPQFSCHNLSELGRLVSGKVCICSDIDRQYLLPYGTPEEIEENIKEVIRIFGSHNGGLIGRAEIGADVPLENAEAAYRAFYEHGVY